MGGAVRLTSLREEAQDIAGSKADSMAETPARGSTHLEGEGQTRNLRCGKTHRSFLVVRWDTILAGRVIGQVLRQSEGKRRLYRLHRRRGCKVGGTLLSPIAH